jgi:hypothetical protein
MITLECSKCNRKRSLDEEDDDEIQNAFLEGWEFALYLDQETLCPDCKNRIDFKEFMGGL